MHSLCEERTTGDGGAEVLCACVGVLFQSRTKRSEPNPTRHKKRAVAYQRIIYENSLLLSSLCCMSSNRFCPIECLLFLHHTINIVEWIVDAVAVFLPVHRKFIILVFVIVIAIVCSATIKPESRKSNSFPVYST